MCAQQSSPKRRVQQLPQPHIDRQCVFPACVSHTSYEHVAFYEQNEPLSCVLHQATLCTHPFIHFRTASSPMLSYRRHLFCRSKNRRTLYILKVMRTSRPDQSVGLPFTYPIYKLYNIILRTNKLNPTHRVQRTNKHNRIRDFSEGTSRHRNAFSE